MPSERDSSRERRVLGLAFTAARNPKRLGADLLIIENHRALAMLICFLDGGMGMSITSGIVGRLPSGSYSLTAIR